MSLPSEMDGTAVSRSCGGVLVGDKQASLGLASVILNNGQDQKLGPVQHALEATLSHVSGFGPPKGSREI